MGGKHKIKKPTIQTPVIGSSQERLVFGFSELRPFSYTDAEEDSEFFIKFMGRLKKLCGLEWSTVNVTARHSFGTEKMLVKNLTEAAQAHVPDGMDSLLVLRATGDNHVFLGYRDGNTFQIIFIEYRFGDVYRHGK